MSNCVKLGASATHHVEHQKDQQEDEATGMKAHAEANEDGLEAAARLEELENAQQLLQSWEYVGGAWSNFRPSSRHGLMN